MKNKILLSFLALALFVNLLASVSAISTFTQVTDNSGTLKGSGTGTFSVNISDTNGTVGLEFNGVNYTVTNVSRIFSASVVFGEDSEGNYNYYWWSNNATSFNRTITHVYTVLPLFSSEESQNLYRVMRGSGAGLGMFIQYMAQALPVLLIVLGLVTIIIVIGYKVAEIVGSGISRFRPSK